MAPDRFHWLIAHDPEAFLVSVDIPEEVLRRELVAALFADARAGVLYDHYGLNLTGLSHSELADQLRVALADASHRIVRLAISIARQCQIRAVVPELVALALSTAVDAYIRVSAAMAIRDLSVEEPNHELATLLNSTSSGEDEARPWELEAAVLMASWPHAISTAEVFGLLNPRYPRNYSGLYWLFISDFAKGLTYDDLNVACDWLMAEPARPNDKRVAPLVNAIVRLCLEHLDEPKYRQTLKHVALSRVDHYKPLFSQKALTREPELEIDDQRMLALLVLEDATNQQALSVLDAMGKSGLVGSDDLAWLIEQYASAEGTLEENLKTVLTHVYNPFDTAHSERVLDLPDDHPAAEVFGFWRSVIELDSPEADAARSQWREHVERMERLQTP
jgi:hypothetical protein